MAQIPNTRGNPQATDIAVQSALPFNGSLSREDLQTVLTTIDSDIAKLYEDRNAVLTDGGLITYLGTTVQFTQNLKLELNSLIAGGSPISVSLGSATRTISADGRMIYAVVDRSLGTAVVTDDAATLPAVVSPNKEVFLLAKRSDSGDGVKRLYFRNGMALDEGQTARLGASGGGDGSGNEILETVKNHFIDGTFDLVTPYIIRTDADSLLNGSSTGVYSIVDKSINLTAAQTLITEQLADSTEFLANTNILGEAELMVFWKEGSVDTAATYQVSRNGGNEYQTVTMERVGSTEVYRGIHRFAAEAANQTLISDVASLGVGPSLNASSSQEVSQAFTVTSGVKYLLKSVSFDFNVTGTLGNIYVSVCLDNSGNPGSVLYETAAIPISSLTSGVNDFPLYVYLAAGTYHIKLRTDATYKANYPTSAIDFAANGTGSTLPTLKTYNGTTWTTANPTTNGSFYIILEGLSVDLRVKIIASMTSKLEGIALFYDKSVGNISTGVMNREVFTIDGDDNISSFALTKFVPNPDLLKVYDVTSGQVYTYGAFSLQGQTVVFDAGQFLSPGNTLTLVFDQTIGGAFDNSDLNGLLLSSNFLGSTDATIDKSQPGRGIFLRSPNGTLYEITVADDGSIATYST